MKKITVEYDENAKCPYCNLPAEVAVVDFETKEVYGYRCKEHEAYD